MAKPPTLPKNLGYQARKMWRSVTSEYELRIDELRVLEDVCREIDLIERFEAELKTDGVELLVKGSMGQPVANPLMAELRHHRLALQKLLGSLRLEDEDDQARSAAARSSSARAAAMARWQRRGA